jgi:hypothetical protein
MKINLFLFCKVIESEAESGLYQPLVTVSNPPAATFFVLVHYDWVAYREVSFQTLVNDALYPPLDRTVAY